VLGIAVAHTQEACEEEARSKPQFERRPKSCFAAFSPTVALDALETRVVPVALCIDS